MRDERKAGYSLISGAVGGLVTMAMHFADGGAQWAVVAGVAHALGIVSLVALLLGGLGLTAYLRGDGRLGVAAVVVFGVGVIAAVIAASISGFIFPELVRKAGKDLPETQAMWRIVEAALWAMNQTMSKVYSVAAAVAVCLWSAGCLRMGKLPRGFAIYGLVSAALVTALIAVGRLQLDRHGMTAVMVVEVVWFVGMGVGMLRVGERGF